jgi:hypothetical protein
MVISTDIILLQDMKSRYCYVTVCLEDVFQVTLGYNSLLFGHCSRAQLYEMGGYPLQEGSDPCVDARITRFCTPKSERHDANQVELAALRPHEWPTRVTL